MTDLRGRIAVFVATLFLSGAWANAQRSEADTQSQAMPARVQAAAPSMTRVPDAAEQGGSQVRIVRLSLVRGQVELDRNTGRGFEGAFSNIPVVAGAKLRTGNGVAEVEFEDNSSLRVAPNTVVSFDQLSRTATGSTMSAVSVRSGMVYVSLAKTKGDVFTLTDGDTKVSLPPGSHVRMEAGTPEAKLAVFDGDVQLERPGSTTAVPKKHTVVFDPDGQTAPTVEKKTEQQALDEWDKQEKDYHKGAAGLASSGGYGLYGVNDLNYYGQFADMPGCGMMWRPYFASAAWDPFGNGVWAWYPGAGYSWVSPYPWGWLPFHSGMWSMCGAGGWGWRPGGQWYGLRNSTMQEICKHPHPHPVPPIPGRGAATLVPVNAKPLTISGLARSGNFVFNRDSAGLGVPRATFGRLQGTSATVERHGVASVGASYQPSFVRGPDGHVAAGPPTLSRSGSFAGGHSGASYGQGGGYAGGRASSSSSGGGTSMSSHASAPAMSAPASAPAVSSAPAAPAGAGGHH